MADTASDSRWGSRPHAGGGGLSSGCLAAMAVSGWRVGLTRGNTVNWLRLGATIRRRASWLHARGSRVGRLPRRQRSAWSRTRPSHRQACTRKGPPGIPVMPAQCRVGSVKRGWRRSVRRLPSTGLYGRRDHGAACLRPNTPQAPPVVAEYPGGAEAADHGSSMTPGESGIRNRLPGQGQCGDRDGAQPASGHFPNALRQPCHHPLRHASRCRCRLQSCICQSTEGNIKVGERLPLATGSECPTPPRPIPRAPHGLRGGRHGDR